MTDRPNPSNAEINKELEDGISDEDRRNIEVGTKAAERLIRRAGNERRRWWKLSEEERRNRRRAKYEKYGV